MVLSIKQMLQLDVFQSCSLLTQRNDVLDREVRGVSVIEVPVENFVRSHELVLSTAMGIGHHHDQLAQFVRDIASAGAAALAISIGPYISSIPPSVIQVAEEVALPLMNFPWECRFSEVSQAVLQRLINEQHTLLEQSFTVHQQFIRMVLAGATLLRLAQALCENLQRPLLVVNPTGRILVQSGAIDGDLLPHLEEALVRVSREPTQSTNSPLYLLPDLHLILVVVRVATQTCGYLITPLVQQSLSQIEQLTLEHASTAAALCFLQQQAAEEMEMRIRDDFVWTLATGNIPSMEYAIARGRFLRYDVTCTYMCVFGQFEVDEIGKGQEIEQVVRHLLSLIEERAKSRRLRVMTTCVSSTIIAFLEVKRAGQMVEDVVRQVRDEFSGSHPDVTVSWGIGGIRSGFENFQQSYQEARSACQIGISVDGPGQITPANKVGMYRVLLTIGRDSDSKFFWEQYIIPLRSYEQKKRVEIMRTLEVYLASHCNVSEAARQLNLHRQSLLHRLQRAEQLTGCNLADAQERFSLELGLRLYRIWEASGYKEMPKGK